MFDVSDRDRQMAEAVRHRPVPGPGTLTEAGRGSFVLQVTRINPISVLRVAALLAVMGLVLFLAGTTALYAFLDRVGAVRFVNHLLAGANPYSSAPAPTGPPVLTLSVVLKVAGGSGLVMAVSGMLLLTVLASLYNHVAAVTGGPRMTLAEHRVSPAGQRAVADAARRPPAPAATEHQPQEHERPARPRAHPRAQP